MEKVLSNTSYLSQPHILEMVLQKHSKELAKVPGTDGLIMRTTMQKVINSSLKLLEEDLRRLQEIEEFRQKYSVLMGRKVFHLEKDNSYGNSPSLGWRPGLTITNRIQSETKELEYSETPSLATVGSIGAGIQTSCYLAILQHIDALWCELRRSKVIGSRGVYTRKVETQGIPIMHSKKCVGIVFSLIILRSKQNFIVAKCAHAYSNSH